MKKLNPLLPLLLLLQLPLALIAQDPQFSQFFANKVYLNPAYAGFDPGSTVSLNYRNQWFGLPDGSNAPLSGGFRTFNATANIQFPCILQYEDINLGMAFSFFSDQAGNTPIVTDGFGLALSHEQPIIADRPGINWLKRLDLRIGTHFSLMQKRLDDDFLIYSYNLDPVEGLQDVSHLDIRTNMYANISTGILLRGSFGKSRYAENLFTLGFTLANVNEPNISFMDGDERVVLPRRTTVYLGSVHRVTSFKGIQAPWYVAPQFRWDMQLDGQLNTQTIGAYVFQKAFYGGLFFQYNFPNNNMNAAGNNMLLPLGRRNIRVLILNAGVDIRTIMDNGKPWRKRDSGIELGFSYDINLGGLDLSNTFGVIEFSLRVNINKDRKANCDVNLGRFEIYNGACPTRF